jgi:hypothetical protein
VLSVAILCDRGHEPNQPCAHRDPPIADECIVANAIVRLAVSDFQMMEAIVRGCAWRMAA